MPDDDFCMIMTTFPDRSSADIMAQTLLDGKQAGCIQMIEITSTYRWQKTTHREPEILALIKTTTDRYASIENLIKSRHPYECPEIIQLPIMNGLGAYLLWLKEACSPDDL